MPVLQVVVGVASVVLYDTVSVLKEIGASDDERGTHRAQTAISGIRARLAGREANELHMTCSQQVTST